MDELNTNELKNQVESRLLQKIGDLEAVRLELEEDIRTSTGPEKEKNASLLSATTNLLDQLKQAQINIHTLTEKSL